MAFSTGILDDPQLSGSGQLYGDGNIILSATTFESGLKVGRFAKLDTASIDNMDGSATPVVAGVVIRNPSNTYEDGGTITTDLHEVIEYIRDGLVSVDVKTGETPAQFDRVYISNDGDANDGLATATDTDVAVNGEFIEEVSTGVWLINVTPPAGDVATHINDALDAHDASAISIADAGGFTASVNVETAVQEMLPAVPQVAVIADPGDAGAVAVLRSGVCAITTAGAETRTVAVPATVGLELAIICDTYVGDATITVASAINQAGNNTIVLGVAADMIVLKSMTVGGTVVWRVVANDGAALSTV